MRKISLDDCGQVMPSEYYYPDGGGVRAIMVIKAPSGEHLALTMLESKEYRTADTDSRQRRAIREFMKRNNPKYPKKWA